MTWWSPSVIEPCGSTSTCPVRHPAHPTCLQGQYVKVMTPGKAPSSPDLPSRLVSRSKSWFLVRYSAHPTCLQGHDFRLPDLLSRLVSRSRSWPQLTRPAFKVSIKVKVMTPAHPTYLQGCYQCQGHDPSSPNLPSRSRSFQDIIR